MNYITILIVENEKCHLSSKLAILNFSTGLQDVQNNSAALIWKSIVNIILLITLCTTKTPKDSSRSSIEIRKKKVFYLLGSLIIL